MQARASVPLERVTGPDIRGPLVLGGLPAGVTALLWLTRLNDVSTFQALLAAVLAAVPLWSFRGWVKGGRKGVPLLAFVAAIYWLYFAVPLFWGDRYRPTFGQASVLPDASITQAMLAAALGVLALAAGRQLGLGRRISLRNVIDLRADGAYRPYLRGLLAVGIVLAFFPDFPFLLGAGLRQVLGDFQTVIPLMAFVILLRDVLRGQGTRVDAALIAAFLAVGLVAGIAGGWVGSWVNLLVAAMVAYLWEKGRLPWVAIAIAAAYVLFLEPGKAAFRQTYWNGNPVTASLADRLTVWVGDSASAWSSALAGNGATPVDLVRHTIMRASLLTQTANVIDKTPSQVAYQKGGTYTYLLAGLVPRLFWQDKPSANDANRFYQVSYGLTTASDLSTVSIAVGSLAEGYINFGWPGILVVMLLLGVLFDFVERSFLSETSGRFLGALGVVILLQFLIIESQLGIYLSGILERAGLAVIVFLPVLRVNYRRAGR
jgi:hypothetical protein